jgi:hypothetical protein
LITVSTRILLLFIEHYYSPLVSSSLILISEREKERKKEKDRKKEYSKPSFGKATVRISVVSANNRSKPRPTSEGFRQL